MNGVYVPDEEWRTWRGSACFFPFLRCAPEIVALREALPAGLRSGVACEPQILVAESIGGDAELVAHVDEEPYWARGRGYSRIVGVALTDADIEDGCLHVREDGAWLPVRQRAGDVVVLSPDAPHSPGVNRSGRNRVAVYFRWLRAA